MRTMIARKYPPLTPHHTQALVGMIMHRLLPTTYTYYQHTNLLTYC